MDCSDKRRCGHRGPGGVSLKLWIDHELIDVWLDDTGIHFRHPRWDTNRGTPALVRRHLYLSPAPGPAARRQRQRCLGSAV